MLSRTSWVVALALMGSATGAFAAEHLVTQKDKKFSVQHLKVRVGDTVAFRSDDPYFHNVFSLSSARTFDLGAFQKGESRSVVFDKPGKVDVECAIHPEMKMTVEVVK